jgi:hypothetical protein
MGETASSPLTQRMVGVDRRERIIKEHLVEPDDEMA